VAPEGKNVEPDEGQESDSERARFARFAKKLVNVPKKEIDEKQREWETRPDRPRRRPPPEQ
jgi:hypothetical protein